MAAPLTTVVIPVKNESHETLVKLLYDLDQHGYPVILVDDGSTTPVVGADIRFEPPGRGYGAALKAGIDKASTDLVVTMDGDGQHTAWDVKRLEDFFCYFATSWKPGLGRARLDMVVGDRRLVEKSLLRFLGRKSLNWLASLFAGRYINDLNSGLRIFRRSIALSYQPILCDTFSFTTSLTLAMIADGYNVDFLPVKVGIRKTGVSHVKLWHDGWVTLKYICWIGFACRTRNLRAMLRRWRFA